jgi:tagatose 1,6-diphosphate aldolase
VPFFLEPLVYDDVIGDETGLAFARKKPEYVARVMEEFSKPRYGVDVLKVELPIHPAFAAGTRAHSGQRTAYSRQEAIAHFRNTASATARPFIYLSGNSTDEEFCEMLEMAAEAGASYSGVLCGRASWQGAIPVYANEGAAAPEHWLGRSRPEKHPGAQQRPGAGGSPLVAYIQWQAKYRDYITP